MNSKREVILELARRYDYDAVHAHQVECLAGTLFMELLPLHHLGREERKLLEYAAILHDIGYYVRSEGHHRHTLQLIMMEPMTELSREEKAIVANIARYHRKALPSPQHTAYAVLPDESRQVVDLLAPLLRIADALDRPHRSQVTELSCSIEAQRVVLTVGAHDQLTDEAINLQSKSDMFERNYNRKVALTATAPRVSPDLDAARFAFEEWAVAGHEAQRT